MRKSFQQAGDMMIVPILTIPLLTSIKYSQDIYTYSKKCKLTKPTRILIAVVITEVRIILRTPITAKHYNIANILLTKASSLVLDMANLNPSEAIIWPNCNKKPIKSENGSSTLCQHHRLSNSRSKLFTGWKGKGYRAQLI